jgi:hypothetical protein
MSKKTAKKEVKQDKPKATKKPKSAKNIQEALFLFQQEKLVLPRNGSGKTMNGKVYKYVTLDEMLQTAGPVLHKYGIGFTQLVQTDKMETKLFHVESGTELTSVINLGSPNNMQDYGGRITYAKRYALGALLGLSSEEDVDATPIPEDKKAGDTPVKPTDEAPATKLNAAEKQPEAEKVQRSESFMKAQGMIDSAVSAEALEMIKGQIGRSPRFNEAEKSELYEKIIARETEVEGTVR